MINVCPKCKAENPPRSQVCINCGLQLDVADDLPISHSKTREIPEAKLAKGGTFAGRYEILEEMGAGTIGRVFKVKDSRTDQELALKLIKPEIASDRKALNRFANELTLAHKITHQSVSRMHHLGEEKGLHYITMEYIPGETLKDFIQRSAPLDLAQAVSLARQVCGGLTEAHKHGVAHLDLKPANIMVDEKGGAHIMDLGIARSIMGKGLTTKGHTVLTAEYMSPEQVEAKDVDHLSDIYSLGIILYEMTTGRPPFEAETAFDVGVKHKSEPPREPKEVDARIPDELSRTILKCLEKAKKKRYQDAEVLAAELETIETALQARGGGQPSGGKGRSKDTTGPARRKKRIKIWPFSTS